MEKLKEWLTVVVAGLVSKPESVEVDVVQDEQGVLYTVKVDKDDSGKVIGKGGTIAEAIRTLLRSAGFIENVRASMKVDAPGSSFKIRDSGNE